MSFWKSLYFLEVLPKKIAEEFKAGKGRDEPNVNPHLPPSIGRMQWTWNPYTLILNSFIIKSNNN